MTRQTHLSLNMGINNDSFIPHLYGRLDVPEDQVQPLPVPRAVPLQLYLTLPASQKFSTEQLNSRRVSLALLVAV